MKNDFKISSILRSKFSKNNNVRIFNLITIDKQVRWIIEKDPSTIFVLKEWRPYSCSRNFFWKLLIISKRLRIINLLPICKTKRLKISEVFLNLNKKLDCSKISIVCFLGRESHIKQKAIIFLINKLKKQCTFVVKKGLSERSWASLQHEYLVLKNLENDNNKYSPKVLNIDKANKIIFQEFIKGKPSSLNLNNDHYYFLASLINKNKYINFKKLKFLINYFFEKEIKFSINKEFIQDFENALSLSIWGKKIKSVRVHGDFTPWNIKTEFKTKNLKVFDWEDSIDSFLPFYDLLYYKVTVQKFLRKRIKIDIKKYLDALNFNGYKLREEYIEDLILISKLCIFIKSDRNFNFID